MNSSYRYTASSDSEKESDYNSFLNPEVINAMPIEDVMNALKKRDLDPRPTLAWIERERKMPTRIYYLSRPVVRIAATILLLVIAAFLFMYQGSPKPTPALATFGSEFNPPLGTMYLTVDSEPVFKPTSLVSAEVPREEYIIDESAKPIADIFSAAAPFGQVLNLGKTNHTAPSVEVIAFLDPDDLDSQELYDDLKSFATSASNARFLLVPATSHAENLHSTRDNDGIYLSLRDLNIDSLPAVLINGYPILL